MKKTLLVALLGIVIVASGVALSGHNSKDVAIDDAKMYTIKPGG